MRFASRSLLTALALAAPLVLSPSSGLGEERASAPEPAVGQAAVCEATPASIAPVQKRIRRAADGSVVAGDPDVVVLNGRGYNYGAPQPEETFDRIELERMRERAERQR